ncbi:MAG: glutathione S-transferase family protein [Microcystaceae cyanobacterium]
MLELYQFELSQYSEKIRLILDYKGLDYRKIEVTPGVGQVEVFRLSGQRQVPVLKDGETVITDSTEIAFYLERKYPENPILPSDPLLKGQCLMIEAWADHIMGFQGRKALIGALNQNPNFRTSLLPNTVPDPIKSILGSVPGDLLDLLGTGVGFGKEDIKEAQGDLKQALEALSLMLTDRPYLVSDQPTLADLTVAGLSIILKYPDGNYLAIPDELKGKGIPHLADNSAYSTFFDWRDQLYSQYRRPLDASDFPSSDRPTSITID